MSIWVTEYTLCPICNKQLGDLYMTDEVIGLPGTAGDGDGPDFMQEADISEFQKFRSSTVHKKCFKEWEKAAEYIDYWNNVISTIPEERFKTMSLTDKGELRIGTTCITL